MGVARGGFGPASTDPREARLLATLRSGDEAAYKTLVAHLHGRLLRLASVYVGSPAIAEEVVQDTWVAVLKNLDDFEGRGSFTGWIYRILINTAKTRAMRERKTVPFSTIGEGEPSVEPGRFNPTSHPFEPGHWTTFPEPWGPEERILSAETRAVLLETIDSLPAAQRAVILLRDVQGFRSVEVCEMLELSPANERVLLHRARSKVRRALAQYLVEEQQ